MLSKIFFWFKKEFGFLTIEECKKLNLTYCHNIYIEGISIWRDKKGKSYRCKTLIYN